MLDTFQEWLQAELDKRGWKQADLARITNLDSAVISNLINSRRNPGVESCSAIAKAFNYPLDKVYRAAGLLPPEAIINEQFDDLLHIASQLSINDRELLIDFASLLLDRARLVDM